MTKTSKAKMKKPVDMRTAVVDVIETIRALNTLYSEETDALKRSDSKAFMALQDQKIKSAQEYHNKMAHILAYKEDVKRIDAPLKDRLRQLQNEFQAISKENVAAIERMQRCTERLGNRLRTAAVNSAQQQRSFSYSETGAIPNATQKKVVSSGVSETV